MREELKEILNKLTFAPEDDITKSGKVMSGKDWKRDIIKAEEEIKEWAMGLLPKEHKGTCHTLLKDEIWGYNEAIAEMRKNIEEGK